MEREITPRRNRLDLNEPAELAIHNAIQEVEKMGADLRLTKAVILLSDAKNLVSDFIEDKEQPEQENKEEKIFLLQYHLSRRSDEGNNLYAIVYAKDLEEAKLKLILTKTYHYQDALDSRDVKPDRITNMTIF